MATEFRRRVHGNPLDADSRSVSAVRPQVFILEIGDDLSPERGDLAIVAWPAYPSLNDDGPGFEGRAPHLDSMPIAADHGLLVLHEGKRVGALEDDRESDLPHRRLDCVKIAGDQITLRYRHPDARGDLVHFWFFETGAKDIRLDHDQAAPAAQLLVRCGGDV